MLECILHLGSNVGDKAYHIELAEILISRRIGMIMVQSKVYETDPWGDTNQENFLNKAVSILTTKSPDEVLKAIKNIERKMGRVYTKKWGPRIIDIDILFYGEEIIKNHNLIIPHPQITNRNFVLIPLIDICPDFVHPVLKKTIRELSEECTDEGVVRVYDQ